LEQFPYVLKHKSGKNNVDVDVLSRRHTLLVSLGVQILGFDDIKKLYENDSNFASIFSSCLKEPCDGSKDIILIKKNFVYPKDRLENFLSKKAMKGSHGSFWNR